jgi:hypothetical protein
MLRARPTVSPPLSGVERQDCIEADVRYQRQSANDCAAPEVDGQAQSRSEGSQQHDRNHEIPGVPSQLHALLLVKIIATIDRLSNSRYRALRTGVFLELPRALSFRGRADLRNRLRTAAGNLTSTNSSDG